MHALIKAFNHIEEAAIVVVVSMMTLAVAAQIVCRYFLSASLDWTEEIARFTFVWCIYMGVSLACMRRKHLKIDAALFLFPRSWRPWVEFLGKVLFLVFALLILYASWEHFYRITWTRPQISPTMRIPMGIAYGAIPLGFGLLVIRLLQDMRRFFRDKEYADTDILDRIARDEAAEALAEDARATPLSREQTQTTRDSA